MKLFSLFGVLSSVLVSLPVVAQPVQYKFNRYAGGVWLHDAVMYENVDNGVTVKLKVNMPSCDSYSNLAGYIGFYYKANDGGWFSGRFSVWGYEGMNNVVTWVNAPYEMSPSGNLSITDNTYCE